MFNLPRPFSPLLPEKFNLPKPSFADFNDPVIFWRNEISRDKCTIVVTPTKYDVFGQVLEYAAPYVIRNPLCGIDEPPDPSNSEEYKEFPIENKIKAYIKVADYWTEFGDKGSQYQLIKSVNNFSINYQEYPGNRYNGENYALGDFILYDGRSLSRIFIPENNYLFKEDESIFLPRFNRRYIANGVDFGFIPHAPLFNGTRIVGYYPIDEYGNFILPESNNIKVLRNRFGIVTGLLPEDSIIPVWSEIIPNTQEGLCVTATITIQVIRKDYLPSYVAVLDPTVNFFPGNPKNINESKSVSIPMTWNIRTIPNRESGSISLGNIKDPENQIVKVGELSGENWTFSGEIDFPIALYFPPDLIDPSFWEIDLGLRDPSTGEKLKTSILKGNSGLYVGMIGIEQTDRSSFNALSYKSNRYNFNQSGFESNAYDPPWFPKKNYESEDFLLTRSIYFNVYNEMPPMKQDCCQDLKRLLKIVIKNQEETIIPNIGKFPVKTYNTLLTEEGVQPQLNKEVKSIAEFMEWQYERLDELMGEWESSAKIKDGDTEEIIRLPNLAEAISEIYSLALQSYTRTDTILNIVTRVLLEAAAMKQQDFKSYKAIMAIIDWMNFKTKEEKEDMPLTCNPAKPTKFDELLKESDISVSVINAADNKHTLNETLYNLMFAANIIKGTFYRKTGNELKDIIPAVKDGLDKMTGKIDVEEVQKWTNELLKKNDA